MESELPEPSGDPSAARFAEIARSLFTQPTVATTLQRIVDTAALTIDGCDGAGVLLIIRRRIVAGAWSNELVREIEEMEYEIGEGPCVDAIWKRPTFESSDLRDEMSLWPMFAARALDLYSRRRGAFDESARAVGTVFAAHAALALAGAQIHARDLAEADGLQEALVTRDVIGQAKGILMATRHVDADAAFDLLRTTSQKRNVRLRARAEQVILSKTLPEE